MKEESIEQIKYKHSKISLTNKLCDVINRPLYDLSNAKHYAKGYTGMRIISRDLIYDVLEYCDELLTKIAVLEKDLYKQWMNQMNLFGEVALGHYGIHRFIK